MEEYYYLCWFVMFIGWLLFTAMGILCADDIQSHLDKLIEENNAKLNRYDKATGK